MRGVSCYFILKTNIMSTSKDPTRMNYARAAKMAIVCAAGTAAAIFSAPVVAAAGTAVAAYTGGGALVAMATTHICAGLIGKAANDTSEELIGWRILENM